MAHLLVLREAPSFVQHSEAINGTDERVEQAIAERMYEYNGARKGYCTPTASEFKLRWYRVKKECLPDFVRDLDGINLNPTKLPKGLFWSLILPKKFKYFGNSEHWNFGILPSLIMIFLRFLPFLKPIDKSEGIGQSLAPGFWNYNFILGYIEDNDRGMGEEL